MLKSDFMRVSRKYPDLKTVCGMSASANQDFALLSHAYSKAVEWGLIDRNPIKGQVKKLKVNRRDRYVEDWEIEEALKIASGTILVYIVLKLLTGLRRSDLLRLTVNDLCPKGITVKPHKTENSSGVGLLIQWTPELKEAVDNALAARSRSSVPWIFCTKQGDPYINFDTNESEGFSSLWQRFMRKALKETNLENRFQEKDLRKKVASDMPLYLAQALLGHSSVVTTKKHYRLKPELVSPHTRKDES